MGVVYLSRSWAFHLGSQKEDLDESYLAGIIHDVGILIFDYLISEECSNFIKVAAENERTFLGLEIKKFGVSYSELDAEFISKWWPISEIVVKSVRRHHKPPPKNKIKPEIPRLVNWVNENASNNEMRNGIVMHFYPLDGSIFPRLR